MQLAGKVVLVTGSTKGIGRDIAVVAAREGAQVTVTGRDEAGGQETVRRIEAIGGQAIFLPGDAGDVSQIERVVRGSIEHWGGVDGLVNNAGIFPRATLLDTRLDVYERVFAINIRAAFYFCQYALPAMIERGGGSVVNIGSAHGYSGGRSLAAYACAKGALHTLTKHIAAVYAAERIRANWITVGWVASEGEIDLRSQMGVSAGELHDIGRRSVPLGRLQTGEEIAWGAVYLLSDQAAMVTGTDLHIAGGLVAHAR